MRSRSLCCAAVVLAGALTIAACGSDEQAVATTSEATGGTTGSPVAVSATTAPAANDYPVSVTSCGHTSTFERAPADVVVGWPTTVDTLTALGVGDAVSGYISASFGPAPAGAPRAVAVSPDYQPSREVMVGTGTDFFLTNDENQLAGSDGGFGYDDLAEFDAGAYVLAGYCIDQTAPTDIEVVYDDITDLGAIFGVPANAARLVADLRARAAAARIPAGDAPSIAVVQVADGKLYALTGAYYEMAVDAVGFTDVFADISGNFSEISPEQVLTLQPDVVAAVYDGDANRTADVQAASELLANTPAVRDGRVVAVANDAISAGGVNLFDVIDELADAGRSVPR